MHRHFIPVSALVALVAACADSTPSEGAPLARLVANSSAINAELVPNEYIVVLKNAGDVTGQARRVNGLGGHVLSQWREGLVGLGIRIPAAKLDAVRSHPAVAYVEQVQMYHADVLYPCLSPGSLFGCPWSQNRISDRLLPMDGMKSRYPNGGVGVTVYGIDTGILITHTEFSGRASYLWDEVGNDAIADDCNGHGTHTASSMIGINYGMADDAMVKASRVLNCAGSGTTTDVIDGINRVTADHLPGQNAVANMSLGGGFSAAMNAAVAASVADGVVYFVAAGNSNADACLYSPASEASANTVGATGSYPDANIPPLSPDMEASYSNHGTCLEGYAPGTNVLGAWYTSTTAAATASGTSMASPTAAGVAAVYLGNNPGKTPAQVKAALWGYATSGVVTSIGPGSPNKLIHNSKPAVLFNP